MAVDNQNCVNHAGYPETYSEKDIEKKLKRFAAKEHRNGWKDDGQKIKHVILTSGGARPDCLA
jgi:hypothetical protein